MQGGSAPPHSLCFTRLSWANTTTPYFAPPCGENPGYGPGEKSRIYRGNRGEKDKRRKGEDNRRCREERRRKGKETRRKGEEKRNNKKRTEGVEKKGAGAYESICVGGGALFALLANIVPLLKKPFILIPFL